MARAFGTWAAAWEEVVRQRRLLRGAATRLSRPKLGAALGQWRRDWEAAEQAAREKELRALAEASESGAHASAEAAARARQAEMRAAQMEQEVAAAAEAAAQAAQAERAKRVEALTRSAARRLLHASLARGWSAWHFKWEEGVRMRRLLLHAASRVRNPELSFAFAEWHEVAARAAAAAREATFAAESARAAHALSELEETRRGYEGKLARLQSSYESVMARLREVDASAVQAEEALTAARAEEGAAREERIKHLCDVVARRMLRRDAARAFGQWSEAYEERAHAMRLLRGAVGRLNRPRLAAALGTWRRDWQLAEDAKREAAIHRAEAAGVARMRELERTVASLRSELQKVGVANASLASLNGALGSDAERLARREEERVAKEREERIELLRRQIGRRMLHRDLARGWQAWESFFDAKAYALGRLRTCANRLQRPQLADAFGAWTRWIEAMAQRRVAAEQQAHQRGFESETEALRTALEEEVAGLRASLVAAEEAKVLALERQRLELTGSAEEQRLAREERLRAERVEETTSRAARRMMHRDVGSAFAAWQAHVEAKADAMHRLRRSAQRLKAPELAEAFEAWADGWEAAREAERVAKALAEAGAREAGLRGESASLAEEVERLRQALAEAEAPQASRTTRYKTALLTSVVDPECVL